MSKYNRNQQLSKKTVDEAMKIAKSIQKPNQTKEQTKLIVQGIQKGIAEYKKQQKARSRELEKLKKKHNKEQLNDASLPVQPNQNAKHKTQWLPWILLMISWLAMASYIVFIP
jgi:hypothetical protein